MDFHEEQEDHEEAEEEEEGEDEEDEDDVDAAAPTTYENSLSNPARLAEQATAAAAVGGWGKLAKTTAAMIRYRECRKNHAVGIGKHAVDGCGEFLPSGAEGTLDALVCAACSCHRNFHRKDNNTVNAPPPPPATTNYPLALVAPPPHQYQLPPAPHATPSSWYHHHQVRVGPTPSRPLALPTAGNEVEEENNNNNNAGSGGSGRKRHRTKFTQEQKERMLGLAEKVGWRIQKHDEAEVERFCSETGVRRQVLKVWMHNNKHTLGKKP